MAPTRDRYVLSAEAAATVLAARRADTPGSNATPSPRKKSSLTRTAGITKLGDSPRKGLRVAFKDDKEATPDRLQQHADAANAQIQAEDKARNITEYHATLDVLFLTVYTEAMLDFLYTHCSSPHNCGEPKTLSLQALMLWVNVDKFNTAALVDRFEGDDALDPCQLAHHLHERVRLVSIYQKIYNAKHVIAPEDRERITEYREAHPDMKVFSLLHDTVCMAKTYGVLFQDLLRLGDVMSPVGERDRPIAFTPGLEAERHLNLMGAQAIMRAFVINRDQVMPEHQAARIEVIKHLNRTEFTGHLHRSNIDRFGLRGVALHRYEYLRQLLQREVSAMEGMLPPQVGKSRTVIEAEKVHSRKATLRKYTKRNATAESMREAMRGDSRTCPETGEIWRHKSPAVLPFGTTPAAIRYQSDAIFEHLKDTKHANASSRPTKFRVAPTTEDGKLVWVPRIPLPTLEEGPFLAIAAFEAELNAQRAAKEGTTPCEVEANDETEIDAVVETVTPEKFYPVPIFSLLGQKEKPSKCAMM